MLAVTIPTARHGLMLSLIQLKVPNPGVGLNMLFRLPERGFAAPLELKNNLALKQVQRREEEKAPVREILKLLGVER